MKLHHEVGVPATVEDAWSVALDLDRVASCLPGAALTRSERAACEGTIAIKLGPITTTYRGTVTIIEVDEASRRAVLQARAKELRGVGTVAATIAVRVKPAAASAVVHIDTDMRVTGPAARLGRGVIEEVSASLIETFGERLAAQMAGAGATDPSGSTGTDDVEPVRPARRSPMALAAGFLAALGFLGWSLRRRRRAG